MENQLGISGRYVGEIVRNGVVIDSFECDNIVPLAARNYALNTALKAATPQSAFYLGIFEGNYTPVDSDVANTFPTLATECSAYSETSRQTCVFADSTAAVASNSASVAQFTLTAPKTLYGAFLSSSSVKGSTAGLLFSAAKFSAPKTLDAGDVVRVAYSSTLAAV